MSNYWRLEHIRRWHLAGVVVDFAARMIEAGIAGAILDDLRDFNLGCRQAASFALIEFALLPVSLLNEALLL